MRLQNLTWSHIQAILGEKNESAGWWYIAEAAQQMWSVKTLERNVGSQYYHRLLASTDKTEASSTSPSNDRPSTRMNRSTTAQVPTN